MRPLESTPIIVDTDLGTDPDDLLALLMIAASPELDLQAITTSYGDTHLRAQIATQTCRWLGIDPIIATGPTMPISNREIWYAGNETRQLEQQAAGNATGYPDAVETILELSTRHDRTIGIVAIGPLTNLAHAVQRDPTLPKRVDVVSIMGGDFADRGAAEHNLACDSDAARIVFEAGFNTRIIGVEQTRRLPLTPEDTDNWTGGPATPLTRRLADDLEWWRAFHHTDEILVHDPLAVAMITHPHLFELETCAATVHTTGDWPGRIVDVTGSTIDVVTDFDTAELGQLIVGRIKAATRRTNPAATR